MEVKLSYRLQVNQDTYLLDFYSIYWIIHRVNIIEKSNHLQIGANKYALLVLEFVV